MNDAKLRHDIISDIAALDSSLSIVKSNWDSDLELVMRLLPLMSDKIDQMIHNLNELKTQKDKHRS